MEEMPIDSQSLTTTMDFKNNDNIQDLAKQKSLNTLMGSLTEAAAMAYGSGIGEGARGGAGHIGMLNGKVVKFNTKFAERRALVAGSGTYDEMMRACDNLRNRLASNLFAVETMLSGARSNFREEANKPVNVGKSADNDQQRADGKAAVDEKTPFDILRTKLSGMLGLKLEHGKLVDSGKPAELDGSVHVQLAENRGLLTREAVAKSITLIRDFLKENVKKGEAADTAASVLVKDAASGERADYDFHIWSKVKAMKGLSSQAIPVDSFTYSQQSAAALKEVARMKFAGGAMELHAIGNAKMKEAIRPIWILNDAQNFGKVSMNMGNTLYTGIPQQKAHEMLRAFRLQSMAGAMDAMFAGLRDQYQRYHKDAGASAVVNALGKTPFQDLFTRSFAKLRGMTEKEVAGSKPEQGLQSQNEPGDKNETKKTGLKPEQFRLSQNELRNLKAMMRNELHAFVLNQGNEFEPVKAGTMPKISVEVMFVKDFFSSCAALLDLDGEAGDYSYVAGQRHAEDRSDRVFGDKDYGKTVFSDRDYNIFNERTYWVRNDVMEQVNRDMTIESQKRTAKTNVLKELFDTPRTVQVHGGDEPATLRLAPEKFRGLVEGQVKKILEKLSASGPMTPDQLGTLRADFVERMISLDSGINVDTRRYDLDPNDPQGVTARELMQKLVGDIFDQHLAAIRWPDAV